MGEIYRGYHMMGGPNDPGYIIRLDGVVIGSALSKAEAYAFIDNAIDNPPARERKG